MKIGITCYPTYGGSGAVATELGIALANRGHEVHFITYRQPFRLPSYLPNVYFHEVDVGNYPLFEYPPYDLALAVRMHEVVRDHKLDLLHCHYAIPHATSAWIAREMLRESGRDVAVVTTLHGTDITIVGQDPSFYQITKFSIERSDQITAVSDYLMAETQKAFQCTSCSLSVIHNFVDPLVYDRALYADGKSIGACNAGDLKRHLCKDRPVLMHISNFRPVKRIADVIRVFAKVRAVLDCKLVMIGDGPDRSLAEDTARKLNVHDDVFFLGKIDAVAPLLADADLFLLPSETESFGLSALEALASGVPVIASDAGGIPEVVKHGETGLLYSVGDTDAMAAGAVELLQNRTRLEEMRITARNDAHSRFSLDTIVSQYEELYATAIDQVNGRPQTLRYTSAK